MDLDQHNRDDELDGAELGDQRGGVLGLSRRFKIGFALTAIAVAVALPAVFLFDNSVAFSSVADAAAAEPTKAGSMIGVQGRLVPGSYAQAPDGLSATFKLMDEGGGPHLQVLYGGEIGQLFFNEYSEIIVEGAKLPSGELSAQRLTVKCPSKYQSAEEALEAEAT